jgi:5-methyltetrahydrofolate--homocysteine methyltransferase
MLRESSDLPVWIKPNAGLPVVSAGCTTFPMGPEEFASYAPAIAEAGANFIGGCCGCGPDHIRALRKILG